MPKETIHLASTQAARALFANDDDNLIVIGKSLNVKLVSRGNFIKIIGESDAIKKGKKFDVQVDKYGTDDGEQIKMKNSPGCGQEKGSIKVP